MDTERFKRMEKVFHAALERHDCDDAQRRAAFLRDACDGDDDLLRSVERLLRQADRRTPLPDLHNDLKLVPGESPGDRINGYRLIEPLGEGGFGMVYRAQQEEPVQREVALKLIKLGMDTKQVIARFEKERDTLARMEHPGIAHVLDAGVLPSGRPYFAMELVRGVDIVSYCAEHEVDRRSRVELMVRVCEAMQHAHQKGVIHRDLKPSNVLVVEVDGTAMPRIIDFGIAKAIDEPDGSTCTVAGQLVGTPAYMSPEQAVRSHDADTRSDVYALGAILYELAAGTPPFDVESLATSSRSEIERILQEVEPPLPCAQSPGVARDLESIILMAMAKQPERRYASAAALADDLRRFLRYEPVRARHPTLLDAAWKFVRRRPALVTASAVIGAVMLAAGVIVVGSTRAAQAASQQTAAVNEFMSEMLTSPRPDRYGANVRLAEVLTDASEHAMRHFEDHPELEAMVRDMIGGVYQSIGMPQRAIDELQPAFAALGEHFGPDDPRTLNTGRRLVWSYLNVHQLDEAQTMLPNLLEQHRLIFGASAPETLNLELARGELLDARGLYDEAIQQLRELQARMNEHLGPEERDRGGAAVRLAATIYHKWLADGRQDADAIAEAVSILQPLIPPAGDPTEGSRISIIAMNQFALIMEHLGELDQVIALTRRVLEHVIPRYGETHGVSIAPMQQLAKALHQQGKHDEAGRWMVRAVDGHRATRADSQPAVIAVMLNSLPIVDASGHYAEGEVYARVVKEQVSSFMGPDHELTIQARIVEAHFISAQGRVEEANELFEQMEAEPQQEWPMRIQAIYELKYGQHLARIDQHDEAIAHFAQAEQLFIEAGPTPGLYRGIWDSNAAAAAMAELLENR